MFWTLFYIVVVFFLIGAAAILRLNKKIDANQRRIHWVKYTFYLLVVTVTVCCIQFGIMQYVAVGLLVVGGYELISGWWWSRRSVPFVIGSIVFYLVIAFGFYRFSSQVSLERVLYVYTIVFTFDGFAQLSGQLFGKRRILPKISPNKTVAGVVGGYVMGVVTGLYVMRWLDMQGYAIWFSPFLVCTAAFIGDALASWYKRNCDLKDYSKFIPGHGGTLDRYDSFIFAGTAFWLFYL